jgi:S1-C subfamily serine protease
LLRTVSVAAASAATTAVLFSACAVQPGLPGASSASTAAPTSTGQPGAAAPAPGPAASGLMPTVLAQSAATAPSPAISVYQQNGGSVVNITSIAVLTNSRTAQQTQRERGIGSGFILDTDGRIVTNNHVVEDADQLTVTLADKTTLPAKLLGRDPDNDLAVIQIDPNATDADGKAVRGRIKAATLADSDQVQIGERAIAIGSPLGLQQTVTEGIVSARRNPGEDASSVPGAGLDLLGGAIQTDAAINPGNSGGPLFNAAGQVIGVNSAILSQSGGNEGVGFAIPINVVKRVAPELIQNGRYAHPQLGVSSISLAVVSAQAKEQLGLSATQKGLLVQSVTAGAQQAGIQAGTRRTTLNNEQIAVGGDVIVAVDGQPVTTGGDLRGYIENTKHPGDTTTVTVLRNGQRVDLTVTLSERPQQQQQQQPQTPRR